MCKIKNKILCLLFYESVFCQFNSHASEIQPKRIKERFFFPFISEITQQNIWRESSQNDSGNTEENYVGKFKIGDHAFQGESYQ